MLYDPRRSLLHSAASDVKEGKRTGTHTALCLCPDLLTSSLVCGSTSTAEPNLCWLLKEPKFSQHLQSKHFPGTFHTHTHTLLLFDNSATHQPLLYLQKCSNVFSPVLAPTCALQLVKNTWLGKTVSFPRLEGAGKHIPSDLWETSNYGALVWDAPYITPRLIAPNYRKKRKFGTCCSQKKTWIACRSPVGIFSTTPGFK